MALQSVRRPEDDIEKVAADVVVHVGLKALTHVRSVMTIGGAGGL